MNNEELISQVLSELKNLKNLNYSKPENEVLNDKKLILEKISNLLSKIQSLNPKEEKQITEAINNIKNSTSQENIDEPIENIISVLNIHVNEHKETAQIKLEENINEQQELVEDEKTEKLSNELQSLTNANYVTKITAKRGRLIREIQREIAKIKEDGKEDEKTLEILEQLETRLQTEIQNHKNQINDRYNKEFLDKEATVPAILTVLPIGVALQATKVETCIREMMAAKTNKQRIFAAVNIAKALGMTVATPAIFAVKFIIKHWYLLLLLLSLIKSKQITQKREDDDSKSKNPDGKEQSDTETQNVDAQNDMQTQNVDAQNDTETSKMETSSDVENPNIDAPLNVSDAVSKQAEEFSEIDAEKKFAYSLAKVLLLADAHAHQSGAVWFNTYEDAVEYVKNNKDLDEIAREFGTIVNDGNYDDIIKRYLVEGDPATGNRIFEWLIGNYGAYPSEQELLEAYRSNELIPSGTIESINIQNYLDNNPQLIAQMQKGDLTGILDYVNNSITPLDLSNLILTGFLKVSSTNAGTVIDAGVNQVTEDIAKETAKGIPGQNITQFPNLMGEASEELEESIFHQAA